MSQRYRGDSFKLLRARMPRNLLVFDGHCLMSQNRVAYVLERNFALVDDPTKAIYFTSSDVQEGKEIFRTFPTLQQRSPSSSSSRKPGAGVDSVVLVERIPSSAGRLKSLNPLKAVGTMQLDRPSEETDDLLVSIKSKACFRILMKTDRYALSWAGWLGYYFFPRPLGDALYDYIVKKRRRLWGTSEEDAIKFPKRILGLKERTWNGHAKAVSSSTLKPKSGVDEAAAASKPPKINLAPRLKFKD